MVYRICLLAPLFFLTTFVHSLAQRNQLYEGRYRNEVGELGRAKFYYNKSNKSEEKELDGAFNFVVTYTDSVQENVLIKKVYDGAYQKNDKQGDWSYDFKRYQVELLDINKLMLDYDINGTHVSIQGAYQQGLPVEKWTYREDSTRGSEYVKTLRRGTANFDDGQLTGGFTFYDETEAGEYEVRGQFNQAGKMHQQWDLRYTIDSTRIAESRTYQHGLLISIVRINRDTDKVIDSLMYDDVIANLTTLNQTKPNERDFSLSDQGFGVAFDHGYPRSSSKKKRQRSGNRVIRQALDYFVSVDLRMNEIQGRKPIALAVTRRFAYELSDEEQEAIEKMATRVDLLQQQLQPLVGREAFELNRQRNDSLAMVFRYFRKLDRQLNILDSVATFMQQSGTSSWILTGCSTTRSPLSRKPVRSPTQWTEKPADVRFNYPGHLTTRRAYPSGSAST